uniref:Uncharacterized protein n=1 Tax=Cacopsylla melanoneura TaxID=428564 RepID=A0A8D8WE73_9HEMI
MAILLGLANKISWIFLVSNLVRSTPPILDKIDLTTQSRRAADSAEYDCFQFSFWFGVNLVFVSIFSNFTNLFNFVFYFLVFTQPQEVEVLTHRSQCCFTSHSKQNLMCYYAVQSVNVLKDSSSHNFQL